MTPEQDVIHDSLLGTLIWQEGQWEGSCEIRADHPCDIRIASKNPEDIADRLPWVRERITWFRENESILRHSIVASEEPLQDAWESSDTGIDLTQEQIAARLTLDSIDFNYDHPGEKLFAWYTEDGMFGDHIILARFTGDGILTDVSLNG